MLPVVCIFGATGIALRSAPFETPSETTALDCHCFEDDGDLEQVLVSHRPHVIVTFGELGRFTRLFQAPFEVRRRWLHFADASDLEMIGAQVWHCYLCAVLDVRDDEPLISVFTPTYRPADRFLRPLASMKAQTWRNWEWVIVDDSDDGGRTAAMLEAHAAFDHRIRVIRRPRNSGRIGEVKHEACASTRGRVLVELDHDDELVPDALAWIAEAYRAHPEAGFYFTDYAEVDPNLNSLTYGDGWGWGLGSYYREQFRGKELKVARTPPISSKTIRGLVAAPNHARAWRRDVYFAIGGHNRELHVCDDLELMLRTFLATRMVHIPRLGYVQYHDGTNTQRNRNADIQRHVRAIVSRYEHRIHERFEALGVNDFAWDANAGAASLHSPNPQHVPSASLLLGS